MTSPIVINKYSYIVKAKNMNIGNNASDLYIDYSDLLTMFTVAFNGTFEKCCVFKKQSSINVFY